MKKLWLGLLAGCLMLVLGNIAANTGPTISRQEILRSMTSDHTDWRVEGAMIEGTFSEIIFVIGLFVIGCCTYLLVIREHHWIGRKGLACLLLSIDLIYLILLII